MSQPGIGITVGVRGSRQAQSELQRLGNGLRRFEGSTIGAVKALGGLFIARQIAGVASAMVGLAADMEQTRVAFDQFTKSGDLTKKVLGDIEQFAAKTPKQFDELADGAKRLLAFGESADNVVPALKRLSELSAATGSNVSDLAFLYGTARTQGRLFSRDIYQFANRGIPIIAALAKTLNVAESEVLDLASKGVVGFKELEAAIAGMTEEGGDFNGLLEKLSQTTQGKASTMRDNLKAVGRTFGESLLPVANAFLDALNSILVKFVEMKAGIKAVGVAFGASFFGIDLFKGTREGFEKFKAQQKFLRENFDDLQVLTRLLGSQFKFTDEELKAFTATLSVSDVSTKGIAGNMDVLKKKMAAFRAELDAANPPAKKTVGLVNILKERIEKLNKQLGKAGTVGAIRETQAEIRNLTNELNLLLDPLADLKKQMGDIEKVSKSLTPFIAKFASDVRAGVSQVFLPAQGDLRLSGKEMADKFISQEAVTETRKRARQMAANLREMRESIQRDMRGIAISIATDLVDGLGRAFGEVIAGAKSVADAFGEVVKSMLVQIPKLVGLALIQTGAATSPVGWPLIAAGLALVGLSGLLQGLFSGSEGVGGQAAPSAGTIAPNAVPGLSSALSGDSFILDPNFNITLAVDGDQIYTTIEKIERRNTVLAGR